MVVGDTILIKEFINARRVSKHKSKNNFSRVKTRTHARIHIKLKHIAKYC